MNCATGVVFKHIFVYVYVRYLKTHWSAGIQIYIRGTLIRTNGAEARPVYFILRVNQYTVRKIIQISAI